VTAAVVVFDFDPVGVILGLAVRWQYVAVAAVIFLALILAGAIAVVAERRRTARLMRDPERAAAVAAAAQAAEETLRGSPPDHDSAPDERPWPVGLRGDDLLFIVAGGIAGAVVGGRLGWVLLYLDWYRANPGAILDTTVGGLTLAGGVVGGVAAGMLMARVLGAPVGRWLGVAVVPLLLALGLGKLAMVLGGAGQGLPSDAGWATAFAGPGPWGSLAPMIPSHPAQVYEALTSAGALAVVLVLALVPAFRRHPPALFAVGICLWAAGRFAVAFTWRDPSLVGGLNGDQLVTAGILGVSLAWLVGIVVRSRRVGRAPAALPTAADAAASTPGIAAVVAQPAPVPVVPPDGPSTRPGPSDVPAPSASTEPPGPGWHAPDTAAWPHPDRGPDPGSATSAATSGTGGEEPAAEG
jgi:phosphatidylglycerol:prolipoprotein diacylglycerol transferase